MKATAPTRPPSTAISHRTSPPGVSIWTVVTGSTGATIPLASNVVAVPIMQWPHMGTYSVLLHDDDGEVRRLDLRRQQEDRAHHAAAARLEVEHPAQAIVLAPEPIALLEQRIARRHRHPADDDARGVAFGV